MCSDSAPRRRTRTAKSSYAETFCSLRVRKPRYTPPVFWTLRSKVYFMRAAARGMRDFLCWVSIALHSCCRAKCRVSRNDLRRNLLIYKKDSLSCPFLSLSIKSFFRLYSVSRGSAHEIDFAKQNHKNREHVSRFLYSKREKVSAWELSDVRVLRSQNTDCRKNEVFRQARVRRKADFFRPPREKGFLLSEGEKSPIIFQVRH